MTFIIGGRYSGRHDYAASICAGNEIYQITPEDAEEFMAENQCPQLSRICERISSYKVVIGLETGSGIVPADEKLRTFRENNGRLNCALAKLARNVIVMTCGIARFIKLNGITREIQTEDLPADDLWKKDRGYGIIFRHGETDSNKARRFAGGLSDVPLNEKGIGQAKETKEKMDLLFKGYEKSVREEIVNPERIFVSPMKRARQTAEILFPKAKVQIVDDICEMKMGLFENMTHEELSRGQFADGSCSSKNAEIYQKWIDSNGQLPCPSSSRFQGESKESFAERAARAFRQILEYSDTLPVLVAHGGVQMALCRQFFLKAGETDYSIWQSGNAMFRFGELI